MQRAWKKKTFGTEKKSWVTSAITQLLAFRQRNKISGQLWMRFTRNMQQVMLCHVCRSQ